MGRRVGSFSFEGCLFEFLGCVFKFIFHFFSAGFSFKLVLQVLRSWWSDPAAVPLVLYSLRELASALSFQWIFFFFCYGPLAWTAVIWNKHWQAGTQAHRHARSQAGRRSFDCQTFARLFRWWTKLIIIYHGGPFWSACLRQKSAHRWSIYLCPSSARTPLPLYPFWSSSACKIECVQRRMCAASNLMYNSKPLASRLLLVICH
jgi:hypothetical protein